MASSEIKITFQHRQCLVGGERAIFHHWIKDAEVILKFNSHLSPYSIEQIMNDLKYGKYVSVNVDPLVTEICVGLVEFENGEIKKIRPENIKFLDGKELFEGYDWSDANGLSV